MPILPLLRSRPALLAGLAVDAVGNGCAGPLLLLYFSRSAGLPLVTVGAVLSGANVVALVVPAIVGMALNRVSAHRLVILGQLLQGLAYLGYLAVRSPAELVVPALLSAVGQRIFWSTVFAVVAGDDPSDAVFAEAGSVQTAGLGVGALLAGLLITAPGTAPFLAVVALNGATFLLSALLLASQPVRTVVHTGSAGVGAALHDRRYLALVTANSMFATCSMLFGVGIPVLLYNHVHSPHWVIGVLLAAVTIAIALGQSRGVRVMAGRSRWAVLAIAGLLWAAWGLVTAGGTLSTGAVATLIVCCAAIPYALADLLHAPASAGLAAASGGEAHGAAYLALFQYSWAIANIVVPIGFTALDSASAALPWLAAAGIAALGAGIVWALGRGKP